MRLSRLKRPKALWWQIRNPGGAPPKNRKRVRPRSVRRERLMAEYRREREMFLLEHPRCAVPGCLARSEDIHHSRGRVGLLLLLKRFWRAVCRRHHDWIGANPAAARELGLLCNAGEWNTIPAPEPDEFNPQV